MFKRLSRYSRQNGHCDVPYRYKTNTKLGEWVANQRRSYRRGKYNNKGDRIVLLESIGFQWGEAIDVPSTTCSTVKQPGRPCKPKEQKKARLNDWCLKCKKTNLTNPGLVFHRIPKPKKPTVEATKRQVITFMGKFLLRQELVDRCGKGRAVRDGKNHKICELHDYENVNKSKTYTHTTKLDDGTIKQVEYSQTFKLYVPTGEGEKSTKNTDTTKKSTGLGGDRNMIKQLQANNTVVNAPLVRAIDISEGEADNESDMKQEIVSLKASNAYSMKELNLYVETKEGDTESPNIPINVSVAREAGMPFSPLASPPVKIQGKRFFNVEPVKKQLLGVPQDGSKTVFAWKNEPSVTLGMKNIEVKQRTGWKSMNMLLGFVFVVCEGDVDLMIHRFTSLTWLENGSITLSESGDDQIASGGKSARCTIMVTK